jgi:hypothetical protein
VKRRALGLTAGAAGTAVMTALQLAEQRIRGGGEPEHPPASGTLVWAGAYTALPAMGIYEPA